MDKHLTIAIPAAHAELARKIAAALWGQPAMFTAGLGATKDSPPTHWVSSGWMPETLADTFLYRDASALTKALGSAVPLADIQAMLAAAVVSEPGAEPHTLTAALNVKALDETAAKTAATVEASKTKYDLTAVKVDSTTEPKPTPAPTPKPTPEPTPAPTKAPTEIKK